MKTIITIFLALAMVSCTNDINDDVNTIGDLKLENLSKLNSNIPQDFYDDLTFTDGVTGYAISRSGKIAKTTNGGLTWTTLNISISLALKKIHFVNSNLGFAIGSNQSGNYVLKTNNAGQTWTTTNLSNSVDNSVNSIYFKNESVGFIVGNKLFKKTIDGGQTWSDVTSVPKENNFQDIMFQKQSNLGYLTLNTNEYFKTSDGGTTWSSIKTTFSQENFSQIQIIEGKLYLKSNSKIININSNTITVLPNPVNKVLTLNDSKAMGIGQHYDGGFFPYGDIMLTNDNWKNFLQKTYQPSGEAMNFTAMAKMSNSKVMIIGTGQLNTMVIILELK